MLQRLSCPFPHFIAQKMKFSIKDFFSKSLMENFIFCAVFLMPAFLRSTISSKENTATENLVSFQILMFFLFLQEVYTWVFQLHRRVATVSAHVVISKPLVCATLEKKENKTIFTLKNFFCRICFAEHNLKKIRDFKKKKRICAS